MAAHPSLLEQYADNLWQIFIPNNPNYTLEWGGMEKQERWGKYALIAVERAAIWWDAQSDTPSLQEIYEFCAWERYKIARALSHEPEYGLSRLDESDYTPRCSTFSPHRLRTKGQFDALKIKFETLKSKFEKPKASPSIFYFLHNEDEVTLFYGDIVIGILSYHSSYQHDDGQYSEALQVKYPNSEIAKQLLEKADEIWQKTLCFFTFS